MQNQPPKDRMMKPRELTTRPAPAPLAVSPKPATRVMSPEAPGYEEFLRRQNRKS
jgi:hypothetical protein